MSLELSLYHLAEGGDLLELFEMRAEAEAASIRRSASKAKRPRTMRCTVWQSSTTRSTAYMAALRAGKGRFRCATSGSASRC